jgi:hypothetical protein
LSHRASALSKDLVVTVYPIRRWKQESIPR